jgi:hypothetical protein
MHIWSNVKHNCCGYCCMGDDTAVLGTTIWLSGAGGWAVPYYICKLHSHKVDCQHGLQLVFRTELQPEPGVPERLTTTYIASKTQCITYAKIE